MESLSQHRFHNGDGGYNGKAFDRSLRSIAHVDYRGEKAHYQERTDHPSLASPCRLKQQQVAQKMINLDYLKNNNLDKASDSNYYTDTVRHSSENYELQYDGMAERELIPPWEPPTTAAVAVAASKSSRKDYVDCHTKPAPHRLQRDSFNSAPLDSSQWEHVQENRRSSRSTSFTPHSEIPRSPPKSTKNVCFNTRDKIHRWDDQIDQLKYVDEEFLGVAQFLLEDVHHSTDDFLDREEEDFELLHALQGDADWKILKGETTRGAGGGLLSKLFHCVDYNATTAEGSYDVDDYKPYLGMDGEILDDGLKENKPTKKYKLTDKLIKDFKEALRYRVQNLEERNNEEDEKEGIVAKTREIARKIEAYGLPSPRVMSILNDAGSTPLESEYVRSSRSEKCRQRRNDTHFFPLLPMDNDDEDLGTRNENERCHRSNKNIADSSTHNKSSIFSFFSSFFKSKSTPSEEQCQQSLNRIGREIKKVQLMNDTTQNAAVKTACAHRIAKLNDEKRFYQIIKEQYKIRHMFKTTKIESVKFACTERMKQLMIELESLDLEKRNDFNVINESKEGVKVQCQKDEDANWYQKVLQYVNGTNNDQYQDQNEQIVQHRNLEYDIPINNEQAQQHYLHQYDQQNNGNDDDEHLPPPKYQNKIYRQQKQFHLDHQIQSPRKTEVPVHENRNVPFDLQRSYYSKTLGHSLPQHQRVPIPNNDHQNASHNQKIRTPPRKGNNTINRLPLATPVPPKKEGFNKLISYLAP